VPSLVAFYRREDRVEVFSRDPVYSLLSQLTERKPAQGNVPAGNSLREEVVSGGARVPVGSGRAQSLK
jgi:hypothetical protein